MSVPQSPPPPEQIVMNYVRRNEYVSFHEIKDLLRRYMPVDDDLSWACAPNVFLWFDLSHELVDLLRRLCHDGRIYPHPSGVLCHVADGGAPDLPVAKKPTAKGYRKPHWLPITWCSFEHPAAALVS